MVNYLLLNCRTFNLVCSALKFCLGLESPACLFQILNFTLVLGNFGSSFNEVPHFEVIICCNNLVFVIISRCFDYN